jgi:hypothetical protein
MPTLVRRARRASLALFFLAACATAVACSTTGGAPPATCDEGGAAAGACAADPCTPFPTAGAPCTVDGGTCSDTGPGGEPYNFAVCYHGTWNNRSCLGYACECPDTLPTAGSTCDACCEEACPFASDAGVGATAQCAPDGTWTVTAGGG